MLRGLGVSLRPLFNSSKPLARGKPAAFDHEIVKRRFRLTAARVSLENKNVLDLGCGNGSQTCEFMNAGCRIVAVDIGFENLSVLAKNSREGEGRAILPVQYDRLHLPLAGSTIARITENATSSAS
jgi:predicted RNA methylase